jgi:hypothetical protein
MFVLDTSLERTARGTVIWPVPAQQLPALPETLDCRGLRLHCKTEFHLTVLAHGDAKRLLGDSRDDALFARWRQAWRDIDHRVECLDELWLLRTIDAAGTRDHALAVACHAPRSRSGGNCLPRGPVSNFPRPRRTSRCMSKLIHAVSVYRIMRRCASAASLPDLGHCSDCRTCATTLADASDRPARLRDE